ncbi:MAG: hypothetical protein ACYCPR_08565 [Thermoplasmataceae archaeon]
MNRKIKLLGVTVMAALMILLAFSGLAHNNGTMDNQSSGHSSGVANMIVGKHNNITTLNTQEMHDLQEFMKYNIIHYGLHSGKLDRLQYKADMNFLTWYIGNFNRIPSAYRGITQQNASVMLPTWENESAQAQSDVQAVANYEVNQHASQYHINTAYIVNNRLGNLVSNRTTMYNNESANLLVYKYTKNNESLVYELIDQKGIITPVDPIFSLNAFTIHWGWLGLISGTSYNMYFNFTTYNNALNFKNFLDTASTITAWVEFALDAILWTAVGVFTGGFVGLIAVLFSALGFVASTVTSALSVEPWTVNNTINQLFNDQEGYDHDKYFEVVYTLNAWESGLVPEFSWWGWEPQYSGQPVLTQIFKSVGFGSTAELDYEVIYNDLVKEYGANSETTIQDPSSWFIYASEMNNVVF